MVSRTSNQAWSKGLDAGTYGKMILKSAGERDRRKIYNRSITSKQLKFMSAVIPGDSSYS